MSRTLVPILTLLGLSLGSAREGAISGTVFAVPDGDVAGTIVIACYAPAGECDDGSPHTHHTVIAQSGTSAPFTLTELAPEQYLLVAMRDLKASDTLDDGDHLAVYGGSLEAPVLVSPPAANLNLQLEVMGATSPQAEAPSATPSPPPELVREWAQGSVSATSFYNPLTGAWAAPSGTGASYHFHLDGSYSYAGLIQTGLYGCTTSVFIYEEGGAYVED